MPTLAMGFRGRGCLVSLSLSLSGLSLGPHRTSFTTTPPIVSKAPLVAPRQERKCQHNMTGHDYEAFASLLQSAAQAGCEVRVEIADPDGRIGDLIIQRDGDGWTFTQEAYCQAMEPSGVLWGLTAMNAALLGVK